MSCQNSLYVLQALVIVNLLACPFNFFLFFFLTHEDKKAEGEGSEEKGRHKVI